MPALLRTVLFAFICVLPLAASAEPAASVAQERYLFELLRAGGWTMVPLGLCLLAAIYLLLYCWRETSRQRFIPRTGSALMQATTQSNTRSQKSRDTQASSVKPAHVSQTIKGAPPTPSAATEPVHPLTVRNSATEATLFERALTRGLAKTQGKSVADARTAAENAIGETLAHAEAEQLRWIGYLNIIAAIAPMIGLLGTVSGMIGAFGTIGAGGMGRPEMLAGNIGEALVSTATGLAVGIPAMLCYHVLHNRLGLRMNETVSLLNDALDEHLSN